MTRAEAIKILSEAFPSDANDLVIEWIQEEESSHPLFKQEDAKAQNTDHCWADYTPDFLLFAFGGYLIGAGS